MLRKITIIVISLISIVIAVLGISSAQETSKMILPKEDIGFLEMVEKKAFAYFWEEVNPENGLIKDGTKSNMCSVASVGWGLSAICVAEYRGWISYEDAYERVLRTLKSFHKNPSDPDDFIVEGRFGLFFHFVDMRTGKWFNKMDCVSTADTAEFIAGVITVMEYFKGTEIERIGDEIVRACEWDKFMFDNDGNRHDFISMGYVPFGEGSSWGMEGGFVPRYKGYRDNSFLIHLIAIASPSHPIPVSSWYACQSTYNWQDYNGRRIIATTPPGIVFHYYMHCWFDLRNRKDQAADYFRNSRYAVSAQQDYCLRSDNYQNPLWGISSCISMSGYDGYGGPIGELFEDGTITPHAIAGGIVFTPEKCVNTLKYLYANYKDDVWGRYGFIDAFNLKTDWYEGSYLGIDNGPIVVMIENFRSGLIWKYFMRNKYIQEAMEKIGFVGIIEDFEFDDSENSYSTYKILNKRATAGFNDAISMEGNRSLEITPAEGEDVILSVSPELKDFSNFKYISLWARNAEEIVITLADTKGGIMEIKSTGFNNSASWKRYVYSIEAIKDIDMEVIDSITLLISPEKGETGQKIYLDGIFLTYSQACKNPREVTCLSVSNIKDSAVCKVTFKKPEEALQYDIRYSAVPVSAQSTFEKLKKLQDVYYASFAKENENIFLSVPDKGKYYFAVQVIDKAGNRSKPVSFGPVIVKSVQKSLSLDSFEDETPLLYPLSWEASSETIILEITKEKALKGSSSLKIKYQDKGDWDCVELRFKKPLNIKQYRYLKINLFGCESVLAKLYNNENNQEDISVASAVNKDQWNRLVYDLSKLSENAVDKEHINKIMFFIAPGRRSSGEIYFDDITLDNER